MSSPTFERREEPNNRQTAVMGSRADQVLEDGQGEAGSLAAHGTLLEPGDAVATAVPVDRGLVSDDRDYRPLRSGAALQRSVSPRP
jgi:hypothetical protein